jgi:CMP-N-acetylneuraminic acid synthetase|tara:strand:- start:432 stop:1013 length:582 start_codon:yes stop_codon:yes gene_type:complete
MILGKKVLAIIPARYGSKRLRSKNLKIFKGKPLFLWSMILAKKSSYIDKIYLSTDSKKISKIAKKNGFSINKLRKKSLSGDQASSLGLVLEAIKNLKIKYDFFILLQPTSPLRFIRDVDYSLRKIINKKGKSLISVNRNNNNINGAIYIQNINFFLKNKKFVYKNSLLYKMPPSRSVDINTLKDFKQAQKNYV